jgi:hypothetical protein
MDGDEALRRAALHAVDQDRLLPGEARDLRNDDPRDAAHWVAVYGELLDLKRELIVHLAKRIEAATDAARSELDNDLFLLVAEESRLARRHRLWSDRAARRAGDGGDNRGIT